MHVAHAEVGASPATFEDPTITMITAVSGALLMGGTITELILGPIGCVAFYGRGCASFVGIPCRS